MKIIFTKSSMPLSALIRWVLKEPASHTAFVFDDKLVVHSDLSGVRLEWFNKFKKRVTIVESLEYTLPLEKEEEVYRSILDNFDGSSYDWGAFFYFGFKGLMHRLFGTPLPSKNPWNSKKGFLCTEITQVLPKWLVNLGDTDFAMVSAYQLFVLLQRQKGLEL